LDFNALWENLLMPPNWISIIDLLEVEMPTYEYHCLDCKKRVVLYQSYEDYGVKSVACPHCGSADLKRLIGRVRFARSEDSRLEDLSDPGSWGDLNEEDPRAMARMMRKMSDEMGEEMPPEFDEVVDRLEAGEDPESIEKSMPELGGGDDLNYDL
jgi:putative FmdB family regulatory protein